MISTPKYGWSTITIGDWSERCSYLDDVPFMLLSAIDKVLRMHVPCAVRFDAEGFEYIIVFDENETHIIELNDKITYHTIEIYIEYIVKELIADIRNDLEEWAWWVPGCSEDQFNERKLDLEVYCDIIEKRL